MHIKHLWGGMEHHRFGVCVGTGCLCRPRPPYDYLSTGVLLSVSKRLTSRSCALAT
jgi:hypothetical protein